MNLSLLTDDEKLTLRSLGGYFDSAEIVIVHWPAETGLQKTAYGWCDVMGDEVYRQKVTDWLAGTPFEVRFASAKREEAYHKIKKTSAIGDDLIQMKWTDLDDSLKKPMLNSLGAKVEFFLFIPAIGRGVPYFTGHLLTPSKLDYEIEVNVGAGFLSGHLYAPRRVKGVASCQFVFGGRFRDLAEVQRHACEYDRHLGGPNGLLDSEGNPFTSCPLTEGGCTERWGDTTRIGGFNVISQSTLVGNGDHTTVSTTISNAIRLASVRLGVPYGTGRANELQLLAGRKETNPSPDHQDAGTLIGVYQLGEGEVTSITECEAMGRQRPAGTLIRTGTHRQASVSITPGFGNYSHTALFRLDLNPIDPRFITPEQRTAKCKFVGKKDIRVYSGDGSFTEQYTENRASCLYDFLASKRYGTCIDWANFPLEDILRLQAASDRIITFVDDQGHTRSCAWSTFNQLVQGGKAQDIISAWCEFGRFTLPFDFNGQTRILPLELPPLNNEVPVFTDDQTDENRNIIWRTGQSTVQPAFKGPQEIVSEVFLTINDQQIDWSPRQIHFVNAALQDKVAQNYGLSWQPPPTANISGYGITNESEAVRAGMLWRDVGPFNRGGIENPFTVSFVAMGPKIETLELHQFKVIELRSAVIDRLFAAGLARESSGRKFTHFQVESFERLSNQEVNVEVTALPIDYLTAMETTLPPGEGGGGGGGGGGGDDGGGHDGLKDGNDLDFGSGFPPILS